MSEQGMSSRNGVGGAAFLRQDLGDSAAAVGEGNEMVDSKLVFSTDPALNKRCAKCKELEVSCTCTPEPSLKSARFTAVLRIEEQGRGGKTVTVIDGLPKVNVSLKDPTKRLKNACGSGGTFSLEGREGRIEIQGDKREQIRSLLSKEGIKSKG